MVPPAADIIIVKHVLLRWLETYTGSLDNRNSHAFLSLPFKEAYLLSVSFLLTLAGSFLSLNTQTGCRGRKGKPEGWGSREKAAAAFPLP